MIKSILAKIVVVLLVLVLIHSVFWFFKTGQLEKNIENFVAENAANVAVGQINVSGYPFSQNIAIEDLKFSIPNSALNKNKIVVKKVHISSGIFGNNFQVINLESVTVQDLEGKTKNVEFNKAPQIALMINDGEVMNFSYTDSGYKIFDAEKNIVYSAASTDIKVDSITGENSEITSKINIEVKEMEGFNAIDIYQNAFEKKVIDGIKTGNIVVGNNNSAASAPEDAPSADQQPSAAVSAADIMQNPAIASVANEGAAVNPPVAPPVVVANDASKAAVPVTAEKVAETAVSAPVAGSEAIIDNVAGNSQAVIATDPSLEKINQALAQSNVAKSNLKVDVEYILAPNKNDAQISNPLDPTQLQAVATQYSRMFKINNIEFSNASYKIILNGQVDYFQDDNMPSGFVTVKVDGIANLVKYFEENLDKIVKKDNSELQLFDLPNQGNVEQVTYKDFLRKIIDNLSVITLEIAAKNPLSTDDIAIFDIRREKNLDFVINDASSREILGKF